MASKPKEPPWEERISRHVWRRAVLKADLTPGAKIAGVAIAEFVGTVSGSAFPSYRSIGDTCGMSVSGIEKAVKQLEKAHLLWVEKRGFGGTNLLTLTLPSQWAGSCNPARPGGIDCSPPSPSGGIEDETVINPARPGGSIPPHGEAQSRPVGRGNLKDNQKYNLEGNLPRSRAREATERHGGHPVRRESASERNRRLLNEFMAAKQQTID